MKNENYKIEKYTVDNNLDKIVDFHKQIYHSSRLKDFLIYYDINFKEYFTSVITSRDHAVYVLKENNELKGFLHYKFIGSSIFLNNIHIDSSLRGGGLASYLLGDTLKQYMLKGFDSFELDVFLSNTIALCWYQKLGLTEVHRTMWKEISLPSITDSIKKTYAERRNDGNGFDGLFYKENKIATVINGDTLVIHNSGCLDNIPPIFTNYITNDFVEPVLIKNNLETSVRMHTTLTLLIDSINVRKDR